MLQSAESIDKKTLRKRVLMLSMGHFVNDTYPGFLAPLQPILMNQIGYGLTLAGLLTSVQAIANSLMQPLFGHFTDRIRRPYLVVIGPLITAIFIGSIGLWHHYYGLLIVVIIGGLGTAAFHPQGAVMTAQSSSARRGFSMSLFVTGGNAGHALGPVIILTIVSLFGLKYSFLTMIYGVIAAWLLWRTLPRLLPEPVILQRKKRLSFVFSSRMAVLLLLWVVVLIRAFIIIGFLTFGPIYLHERRFSLMLAGLANTILEIFGSAGNVLGGLLSDRIGRKRVILLSLIFAFPFFWLYLHGSGYLSLLFLAMAGFFLYSSISVNIIMAQEMFPQQSGTVSSLMMGLAWGVGGLCVTPLGAIAENTGVASALHGLIYLILVAVIAASLIPKQKSEKAYELITNG